jgi:hypothetical protein
MEANSHRKQLPSFVHDDACLGQRCATSRGIISAVREQREDGGHSENDTQESV